MKIATLQFSPRLGDLEYNIEHANVLLEASDLKNVDLLVVPELALTGYNFPSLQAISDFLEPSCGGVTAWWALKTAQKYGLVVSVGYPEITTDPHAIPKTPRIKGSSNLDDIVTSSKEYVMRLKTSRDSNITYWTFNSSLTVGPNGDILAHYRKTHLYYSDTSWASPSIEGFQTVPIEFSAHPSSIATSFAICMDLNPKAFTAEWTDYEVASQMISSKASLLVVSTAWLTQCAAIEPEATWPCCSAEDAESPEMYTIAYWMNRLIPLVSSSNITTVVIANRVGNEKGDVVPCDLDNLTRPAFQVEINSTDTQKVRGEAETDDDRVPFTSKVKEVEDVTNTTTTVPEGVSSAAHYAGSSLIATAGNGVVNIHGLLGRGTESVLVADTNDKAVMTFRLDRNEET